MDQSHKNYKWILILAGVWLFVFVLLLVWYTTIKSKTYKSASLPNSSVTNQVKTSPVPSIKLTNKPDVLIGIVSSTRKLVVNQPVEVEVRSLTNIAGLSSGDFVFKYDPKVLKFVKIVNKKFDDVLFIRNDDKAGQLFISVKNDNPQTSVVEDVLLSLEFSVLTVQPAQVTLVFDGVGKSTDTNIVLTSYPGEDALTAVDPKVVSW